MGVMNGNARAASPESTGGAGVAFEVQADAAFLALLLVGGSPPLLRGCKLVEVHLQTRHLGWQTDDILLVGVDRTGRRRQAALQAKRQFSISESDDESSEALARAWADFEDSTRFNPASDVLGIVLQSGSSNFLHAFRCLLNCARASQSADDFERRLSLQRYMAKTVAKYRDTIRVILRSRTGGPVPDERLFQFLRVLDFVQMDLGASAGSTETCMRAVLEVAAAVAVEAPHVDVWPTLVATALNWAGRAQAVTADDVAIEVGWPHLPASAPFERELASLRETTEVVLRRITHRVGAVEVPRTELEGELGGMVTDGGIVVVTGEPGVGKSALAARVFRQVEADGIGLAFRPGMLVTSGNLNAILLPHGQTAARLGSLGALYSRNAILVESAERLLEAADAERDAFGDLLATLGEDPRWVVMITCRSFAVETFRRAFLSATKRQVRVLSVPDFTDEELDRVVGAIPMLAAPASAPMLRKLLRNPFYLDMAEKLDWSAPLPADARAFRSLMWRQVVRKESHQGGGMPTLRANAFKEVVRRRACSLEPYVMCHDLDAAAIQELRRDMLVAASPDNPDALTPSHDVLEDWALLQWLDDEFRSAATQGAAFFDRIGTYPAVRRAYRVWLSEWLDSAFDEATTWARGVIQGAPAPQHWIDDTLTAAMLSEAGARFIGMVAETAGADRQALLNRMLHLARVACRRLPDWEREPHLATTRLLLPEGGSWEALLLWLETAAKGGVQPGDAGLYLNFLEDWSLGVSPDASYPAGATSAARVALRVAKLAPALGHSERDKVLKRALRIALRLPQVVEPEIRSLVETALRSKDLHHDSIVLDLVLGVLTGASIARDLPDLTERCVEYAFGFGRKPPTRGRYDDHALHAVEVAFGFPPYDRGLGFPPSALHGPFHQLLRHHWRLGIDLIVRVVNRACDAYGERGAALLEAPGSISLELADGRTTQQWISGRLWGLYRSTTVGPGLLQSALMALEAWLLAYADAHDPGLEALLLDLLARSNNVALTAVVASVAQAWPAGTWRAILPLLARQDLVTLDRMRWVNDQGGAGRILEDLVAVRGHEDEWYADERKQANRREHRKMNLETVALELQLSDAREEVWRVIDAQRASLPPVDARSEAHRLWDLALHRMDLRRFETIGTDKEGHVLAQPGAPPPDVAKMIDEHRPALERSQLKNSLLLWAKAQYDREPTTEEAAHSWREKLSQAQNTADATDSTTGPTYDPWASAPAYVAAVCARDHWGEMNDAERDWCVRTICDGVEAAADKREHLGGGSFSPLDGWMIGASVVPGLVRKATTEDQAAKLLHALGCGVLHSDHGFVEATVMGIGRDLLAEDRGLALACVRAIVEFYTAMREGGRGFVYRHGPDLTERRRFLRGIVEREEPWPEASTLTELDYTQWPYWGLVQLFLALFSWQPTDELGRGFLARISHLLAQSWTSQGRPSSQDNNEAAGRFEAGLAYGISRSLASLVLQQAPAVAVGMTEPLRAAMSDAGDHIAHFIRHLILAADGHQRGEAFVAVWRSFAQEYVGADGKSGGWRDDLLPVLFLDVAWKPGAHQWEPLSGHEQEVALLFSRLQPSGELIESFAKFLCTIGRSLVPQALVDLADRARSGGREGVQLSDRATGYLEQLLAVQVYGGSAQLRTEGKVRDSVLWLLDRMVDGGSSAAYRMRDDFLTPLAARPQAH